MRARASPELVRVLFAFVQFKLSTCGESELTREENSSENSRLRFDVSDSTPLALALALLARALAHAGVSVDALCWRCFWCHVLAFC